MMDDLEYIALKGEGYFCNVKLYRHRKNGREFAFKELKKEHYSKQEYHYRLVREIKILKDLEGCENVVSLVDFGENKERMSLWYVMPFAHSNLFEYIRKNNGSLTHEERFSIIDQVLAALKFAHQRDILHRDISPNNVLVYLENGMANMKVSDFGLGKNTESISYYTASSASGYGQILYVAPEQRQKLSDATIQSDIYSLGKLIYFIYTGRDPDNMKPFELYPLVSKATEELPGLRYENIDEFERHYLTLKHLQLNTGIPLEHITLAEVANGYGQIDFHYLHKILVQGNVFNHVYSDYLAPVLKIFEKVDYFISYRAAIGPAVVEFVRTLCDRLDECLNTVGWPFNAATDFGILLKNIMGNVEDDEVRFLCFKQLWKIAFEMDQWSVQRLVVEVVSGKTLSSAIAPSIAEFILNFETEIDLDRFKGALIPAMIKKAIIDGNNIVRAKSEARKAAMGFEDFEGI